MSNLRFDDLIPQQQRGGISFDDLVPSSGGLRVDIPARPSDRVQSAHNAIQQDTSDPLMPSALLQNNSVIPTQGGSFARGAVQGATLNFGDEIIGAAAASGIPQAVSNALGGGTLGRIVGSATALPAAIVGGARMAGEALAPSIFGNSVTPEYERVSGIVRDDMELDQRVNPWSTIAGNVAGGLALPVGGAVGQAGTVGRRFATGARLGAVMGAGYGAGDGEDLSSRATGAAVGGLVGGFLGGGINAALGPRLPVARPSTAGPSGEDVVQAAGRLDVQIPRAVTTDNMAVQRTAAGLRNVPIAGDPIVQASRRAQGQLNDAANRVADDLGATSREEAGNTALTAMREWTTTESREITKRAYDAVDAAITQPGALTPLQATQGVVSNILTRRTNAALPGNGQAVDFIAEAVMRPGGLNYEGVKQLRTAVGEMMRPGMLPQGMSDGEVRAIYGALSDDLRNAVRNSGGARAEQLFNRANRTNQLVQERRDEFARIIGKDGSAPAEQVLDRLLQMASDKAGGNLQRLVQARRVMDPAEWQEVSGTLISRLGRDAEGNFTPDRFVTAWGNLSDQGRNILFGGAGGSRQALDDIATISSRFKQLNQFSNPSGTAQNVGFAGIGAGTFADPVSAATIVLSGRVMSSVLASPSTASSMARWARTYEIAARRPSAASVAALQSASRNFANTIGERLGVSVDPMDFLRAMQGSQPIRAEGEQNNQQ
jgi:hypothetical protein